MNVTVTMLGRATVDQPFAELGTQVVALGADPVPVTPVVPPEAAGQELRVRVASPEAVTFAVGAWLDPSAYPAPIPIRDAQGVQIGVEKGPTPTCAGRYGVHGGTAREAPMPARGGSIVLRRVG